MLVHLTRSASLWGLLVTLTACRTQAPRPPAGPVVRRAEASVPERMGLPASTKLLILHADDVGLAGSVNRAFAQALEHGVLRSGSVMVPAPAFQEIAAWARLHPTVDLGLHTTLTSEWRDTRWGPVLGAAVPSLADAQGRFYPTSRELITRAALPELEREVRAQLARAREAGVRITHLDAHMGGLYGSHDGFALLVRLATEHRLPFTVAREWFVDDRFLGVEMPPGAIVLEQSIGADERVASDRWLEFYVDAVRALRPGVSQIIFHPGFDDQELRDLTVGREGWAAAWRKRDLDVLLDPAFRRAIDDAGVRLVTWADVGKLL